MKKGVGVVAAATGLNLALGVLYAWSVFARQMTEAVDKGGLGWSKTASALPYTAAIAVFALVMIPAGRLQDRLGPRLVAGAGALLTGCGLFLAGYATPESMAPAILGFGILGGAGFGLGYSAATPAAVKWFPPEKKGLVTGVVVSGFGLAPVYIAPLSSWLMASYGVDGAFRILGVAFAVVATVLSRFIVNPPAVTPKAAAGAGGLGDSWRRIVAERDFALLYVQFFCAATAGLMIIGHLSRIVAAQTAGTVATGFLFVALLAVFNAGGRIVAGVVSDRVGRVATIVMVSLLQAATMLVFPILSSAAGFFVGAGLVGFSYGACLSLFPSTAADRWGTRDFGRNYGLLFTAWGLGGVFGPLLAGYIADRTGSYGPAFQVAAGLLVVAAVVGMFMLRVPGAPALSPERSDGNG